MAWSVGAGSLARITDVAGGQTGDVFVVAADDLEVGQSNGRSFDLGDTIRLSTGSVLYSRRSRPLVRMNVAIGADGGLDIKPPLSTAGQSLTLAAERDILIAITACPSPTGTLGVDAGARVLRR